MPDTIPFWKYEATGNDFVLLEAESAGQLTETTYRDLCDRRGGIGADQVLILHDAPGFAARLEIRNADGREAEMCGNGLRAIGLHLQHRGLSAPWQILTPGGVVTVEAGPQGFQTNLGKPSAIRVEKNHATEGHDLQCLSIGNPHAVARVPDLLAIDIGHNGEAIRWQRCFGVNERPNVHFVQVEEDGSVRACSSERGSGPTLSCGSGAAAIAAACLERGWVKSDPVRIWFAGGDLSVTRDGEGCLHVAGPARLIFHGQIDPSAAERADRSLRS